MNEITLVILFSLGLFGFIMIMDWRSKMKLKQRIQAEWGKLPRRKPKDSEESLQTAYQYKQSKKDLLIDQITWTDLDLFEVFERLNLTYSSIGSEALYAALRAYNLNDTDLKKLEETIAYFDAHPTERMNTSYRFAQLGKKDFNYAEAQINQQMTNPLNYPFIYALLGILPLIGLLLTFLNPIVGVVLLIASLCLNTLVYLIKKSQIETELAAMNYLVQGIALGHSLSKKAIPRQSEMATAVQPFKSLLKLSFAFRVKSGGDSEMLLEMLSAAFLIPFISYSQVVHKVNTHNKEVKQLWEILGHLEVAIAVLNLRLVYKENWCLPEFCEEEKVTSQNMIHPLLDQPVPNPINWKKSTLITGSNASGKSTYVRGVALNCLLAQTLNTCLATRFTLKPGLVISSMGVQDSVIEGDSYFIAELKSLKRLIRHVQSGTFCYSFIDEILKGTNTIERIAASSSTIEWLTTQHQLAFVATHDIELPQILGNHCDNIHFEESVSKEEGVSFDYLIKEGVATSRNAIKLIESMKFPPFIIEDAFKQAQNFDENKTWVPKQ